MGWHAIRTSARRLLGLRRLTLACAALGVTAGVGTTGVGALMTDAEAVTGNAFTVGSVDLTASPSSALVTFSGMMPGDKSTGALTVSNSGTAALRYAITSAATNADAKNLRDQLALVIRTVDVTTPASPCNDFDGTQLYTGDLDGTTGALVGSTAQGADAGDRTLAASANEVLCFRVTLPSTTTSTYASAATTATFTLSAEQTANN